MDGPENANFPLLFIVKMSLRRVGGWVVQKSLKTPLRNIEIAPNHINEGLQVSSHMHTLPIPAASLISSKMLT